MPFHAYYGYNARVNSNSSRVYTLEKNVDSSERGQRLMQLMKTYGLNFGREDSFKLYRQGMLTRRTLLGIHVNEFSTESLLEISAALGMPTDYQPLVAEKFAHANMVFFGLEDRDEGGVFKVYLELWDQLKKRVLETGSTEPAMLNVGVKWDTQSGKHCRADYLCFPMLSVADIVSRIDAMFRDRTAMSTRELTLNVIRQAAAHNPATSFLYVEVSEGDSPRNSFDINLYKANLKVSDISALLVQLGRQYETDDQAIDDLCKRIGHRQLGHFSGGLDRHGRNFTTVYYEVVAR